MLDGASPAAVQRTVDPVTGAQTLVESVPIVLYDFEEPGGLGDPAGIVLERTSRQEQGGRRIRISDVYRSVDGAAHRLEVRYSASAGGDPYRPASVVVPPTFRVPWDTGDAYVPGTVDRPIGTPPASGRTTIWLTAATVDHSGLVPVPAPEPRPLGRAGRAAPSPPAWGAVTYDSAPVDGLFISPTTFVTRFERAIPAGGTASLEHVYTQDLTRTGVEELVRDLDASAPGHDPVPDPGPRPDVPGPVPAPAVPFPAPGPPAVPAPRGVVDPLPRLSVAVRTRLADRRQGSRLRAQRPVAVSLGGAAAGRYGVTLRRDVGRGRGLRTIATGVRTLSRGGTLRLSLRPTRFGRRYLAGLRAADRRSVRLRVVVTWTPPGEERRRRERVRTATLR